MIAAGKVTSIYNCVNTSLSQRMGLVSSNYKKYRLTALVKLVRT